MTTTREIETCKRCHRLIQKFLSSKTPLRQSHDQSMPSFYNQSLHDSTQEQVRHSYSLFLQLLDKYDLDELSISYNGGKDCLVMLVIYLAAICEHNLLNNENATKTTVNNSIIINSVYIYNETTFELQDQFLAESISDYSLSFTEIQDTMKSGFAKYLKLNPSIRAVIVGIRRIDPYGSNLKFLQKTDHGWPDFVRAHPVLEWNTTEIWYFIKSIDVKYCRLYDEGFTSLGGVNNTIRNPLLKIKNKDEYLPAYMLQDDVSERLSRVTSKAEKL